MKVPLRKPILIITSSGDYICKIRYADEEKLHCVDVVKVEIEEDSNSVRLVANYFLSNKAVIFRKDAIIGYTVLDEVTHEEVLNKYREVEKIVKDHNAKVKRSSFYIVTNE